MDGLGQDGTAVDTLTSTLASSQITPDPFVPGRGTIVAQDAVLGNPLLPLSYDGIENPVVSGTTVVIQGTEADDTIELLVLDLDGDGNVDDEVVRMNGNPVDVGGYANIVLNGLGGDDSITITPDGTDADLTFTTVKVIGG